MSNYKLYTTKSCIVCEKAKRLIKSQQLDVEIIEAEDKEIAKFREMNIRSFPILLINQEKYIHGMEVGNYIAMNIEELRKK